MSETLFPITTVETGPELEFQVIHTELLKLIPPEEQSPIHTEFILHNIATGNFDTAEWLVEGLTEGDGPGLEYVDKLRIFRAALASDDDCVALALGDMRAEAEALGPQELVRYLSEELRLGWNVFSNMDALSVISSHIKSGTDKYQFDRLSDTVSMSCGVLAARLLLENEIEDLEFVLDQEQHPMVMPDNLAQFAIRVNRENLTLKNVLHPSRDERRDFLKYEGLRTYRQVSHGKEDMSEERLERMAGKGTNLPGGGDTVLLYLLDSGYRKAAAKKANGLTIVAESLRKIGTKTGAGIIIGAMYPELDRLAAELGGQAAGVWYKKFTSPDSKPELKSERWGEEPRKTYPENVRYLREYIHDGYRGVEEAAKILANLSVYVRSPQETAGMTDDELKGKLLGDLELVQLEIDALRPTVMKHDIVDRMRHQVFANKPLRTIFATTGTLNGATHRLSVQYAIFKVQEKHDPDSVNTNLPWMREKLLETANKCLLSPLDKLLYGEDNIRQIIEDVQE